MKVFTRFVFIPLFLAFAIVSNAQPWPQDASLLGLQGFTGTIPLSALKNSLSVTACGGTSKSLDGTVTPEIPPHDASSGSMNNDTWFAFQAGATVAKIRVCDPNFDAAVEVYKLSDGAFITSFNIAGNGGREYGIASGLTYNDFYAVRVGRYSGSGAGTFTFNVEHLAVWVQPTYSPGPAGASCYKRTDNIQRSNPTAGAGGSMPTRWKFTSVEPDIICTGIGGIMPINSCYQFCKATQYTTYCEVQATDTECGFVWWGYSIGRATNFCDQVCPTVTAPANNTSLSNIRGFSYQTLFQGTGSLIQWKFVTDNGAKELCSPWQPTSTFVPSVNAAALASCLEFNKFYNVYVRVRYCATDPEPEWCGNPISVFSQAMPRMQLQATDCCKWRNKTGTLTAQNIGFPYSQFRFRFTPVATMADPCPSNNLAPIGPAVVTGWLNYFATGTNLAAIQPGTIYNVQIEARLSSATCTNCNATNYTLPTRYVDWSLPCLIGFRTTNGPAAGTSLSCGCNIGSGMMLEDWDEEAYAALIAQFGTIEVDASESDPDGSLVGILENEESDISIYSIAPGTLQMDLSAFHGDAEVRIYDVNGRLITSRPVFQAEDKSAVIVAMDKETPAGVYVISIIGQDSVVTQKIFISGY